MFGYIRAYKPEMKIKEYETYKAIYCSLCKELGHSYGIFARFTLSYDFVFLAIAASGITDGCPKYKNGRCAFNPLKKCGYVEGCNNQLSFSAGVAMIMLYYKLLDNIKDGGFFKKTGYTLIRPFIAHARKKALKTYGDVDKTVAELMEKQFELESRKSVSTDEVAEPSAMGLSKILSMTVDNEEIKPYFERIGYCIGKWVYLADALDDYEKDIKKGNFNPFISGDSKSWEQIAENALGQMNFCICEACEAFEKINFLKFRTILENILYMGLPAVQEQIIKKERKK